MIVSDGNTILVHLRRDLQVKSVKGTSQLKIEMLKKVYIKDRPIRKEKRGDNCYFCKQSVLLMRLSFCTTVIKIKIFKDQYSNSIFNLIK